MYHIIHVVGIAVSQGGRVRRGTISLYSRSVYDGFCVLIDRTITQPSGRSSGGVPNGVGGVDRERNDAAVLSSPILKIGEAMFTRKRGIDYQGRKIVFTHRLSPHHTPRQQITFRRTDSQILLVCLQSIKYIYMVCVGLWIGGCVWVVRGVQNGKYDVSSPSRIVGRSNF